MIGAGHRHGLPLVTTRQRPLACKVKVPPGHFALEQLAMLLADLVLQMETRLR